MSHPGYFINVVLQGARGAVGAIPFFFSRCNLVALTESCFQLFKLFLFPLGKSTPRIKSAEAVLEINKSIFFRTDNTLAVKRFVLNVNATITVLLNVLLLPSNSIFVVI